MHWENGRRGKKAEAVAPIRAIRAAGRVSQEFAHTQNKCMTSPGWTRCIKPPIRAGMVTIDKGGLVEKERSESFW